MEALRCAVLAQDGTTVENIVIADQSFAYSNGLIVCGTIPVGIGDIYMDGYFYRNGVKLEAEQTAIEQLQAENAELRAKIESVSKAVECLLNTKGTP